MKSALFHDGQFPLYARVMAIALALSVCIPAWAVDPPDDTGDTIAAAEALRLRRGQAKATAAMEYDGDLDVFSFNTVNAAPLTFELVPASRKGTFDGTATLYDDVGAEVACQVTPDGEYFLNAVGTAETYYIEVAGPFADDRTADRYKLYVYLPVDAVGNTIDDALELRMRRGKGMARSSIDFDWDVDVFCAVAASTSPMTIDLVSKERDGSFDGELRVYDSLGNELAYYDDPAGWNAQLAVDTTVGESYYIEVGAVADSVGRYNLAVLSPLDDHGNTIDMATTLEQRRGVFSASGTLDFAGDVDMFCVVSPVDGQMQVIYAGKGRKTIIDPEVTVLDDQGGQIAADDGNGEGATSAFGFDVTQGEAYYVQVGDAGVATGKYTLTLTPDEQQIGPTPLAEVANVDNSSALTGYVTQDIVFHTQTDWLSAQMVVDLTAGSIYQDVAGSNISPNPLLFGAFPTLEFDSYVSNGVVGEPVSTLPAADMGGTVVVFDESAISVGWFTTGEEIGDLALARVTLSESAAGTWRFKASSSPAGIGPTADITGTISNGVMTAD